MIMATTQAYQTHARMLSLRPICCCSCFAPPGGVLQDDWLTPHDHKLSIIAMAHPNPSQWPKDPVQPAAPTPEQCRVEAKVDPAAHAAPVKATTAAAAAAAPAPGPSGQEVYSDGNMLQVGKGEARTMHDTTSSSRDLRRANAW